LKKKEKIDKKTAFSAIAFAPGHITGFFEIFDQSDDPLYNGSRGAGISLARGVTTRVVCEKNSDRTITISINNQPRNSAQVSSRVVELFFSTLGNGPDGPISIEHTIDVPQGAGFGSSGAGALSLAYALNAAWGEPLRLTQAGQIAHRAELECRTGLGTVLACTVGGLEVRVKAGAPGIGEVRSFPLADNLSVLAIVFGPLSTQMSLSDPGTRKKINDHGASLIERLLEKPEAGRFMETSRTFAEAVGLISPRLRSVLDEFDSIGIAASMNMFGESIFCIIQPDDKPRLERILEGARTNGAVIFESPIAKEGGRLIHAS
jgi:pantoate kinase